MTLFSDADLDLHRLNGGHVLPSRRRNKDWHRRLVEHLNEHARRAEEDLERMTARAVAAIEGVDTLLDERSGTSYPRRDITWSSASAGPAVRGAVAVFSGMPEVDELDEFPVGEASGGDLTDDEIAWVRYSVDRQPLGPPGTVPPWLARVRGVLHEETPLYDALCEEWNVYPHERPYSVHLMTSRGSVVLGPGDTYTITHAPITISEN